MSETAPSLPFVVADRYDVTAELGRGGFAVVYLAHDRVLGRDVAIKILRHDIVPQSALRRFSLEMRVTARLEHPNILHVYDTGTWDSRMFYVMEYVRGRTLETRLSAEGALPVDDALTITRDVGQALAFAHESGVVHRDVKPANILLGPAGALLGDFGIAHVLSTGVGPITSTGLAVGTLQYMSPEQLCAEPKIDARADQYSLALVCYEMLTGVQPHVASSVDALRALRLEGGFAPVSTHRPTVPGHVDEAMSRALSPTPADRFRDTREFMAVLDGRSTDERWASMSANRRTPGRSGSSVAGASSKSAQSAAAAVSRSRRISRSRIALGTGALLAVLGLMSAPYLKRHPWAGASIPATDAGPTVAFVSSRNHEDSALVVRLRSELDEWHDVETRPSVEATSKSADSDSPAEFRDLASRAGATILVRPSVSPVGDSVRWALSVYDASVPSRITHQVRVLPRATEPDAGLLRAWAIRLLVGPAADSSPGIDGLHEPLFRAARAYANGWRLMRSGAFEAARSSFSSAAATAPNFAQAHLWAAQMGAWSAPNNPSSWRDDARRAADLRHALQGSDSLLAQALVSMSTGDPPGACARYRSAIGETPDSFAAWFGLGQCQQFDSAVVGDGRVPGGLRFRSSHWSAVSAYEKALERLPADAMSSLFVDVVAITYASGNKMRAGFALAPDTGLYFALPSLDGDSVQNLPLPRDTVTRTNKTPETFSRALDRARRELLVFTREWVSRAPSSADAWFYRAYALELTGALDAPEDANSAAKSLSRADSLNSDVDRRARIDVARVRVAARRESFDEATRLARAALARRDKLSPRNAASRAPLAAFIGDMQATDSLLRIASTTTNDAERHRLPDWVATGLPPWLSDSLRSFGVRAILGICDGLGSRRDALDHDLRDHVAVAELDEQRGTLLRSAYWAAVPCLGPSVMRGFKPGNPLEEAVAALDTGDVRGARRVMDGLNRSRRGMSVATLTEDVTLAETWIWMQTGDTAHVREMVRANLHDLARMSPSTFEEVSSAAALSRIRRLAP